MSKNRKKLIIHQPHFVFGHFGLKFGIAEFHLESPHFAHRIPDRLAVRKNFAAFSAIQALEALIVNGRKYGYANLREKEPRTLHARLERFLARLMRSSGRSGLVLHAWSD
jgi:hypothetical protein